MEADSRGSRWRRRGVAAVVTCIGAVIWAGLAFGGGAARGGGAAPHATKAAKRAHVVRARMRAQDGTCPHMGADTGASL